jgi:pantoate--beta-alanine ligase
MNIWKRIPEWQARRAAIGNATLGFVPTMGALHRGHASLVERCRQENELTLVSIFVNPAQFNDPGDLTRYPRTLEADLALLESLGVHDVLLPSAEEMYPQGYRFRIAAPEITNIMEGVHRPGFFEGVMTVVMKLLCLATAHRAYFGEKDYQQYRVISEMAADFFLPTEIVPCATIRTASGLAESSRNALLSSEAVTTAACIYAALTSSESATQAKSAIEHHGLEVEYVEDHWERRFAAAWLEGVRLIDNAPLR